MVTTDLQELLRAFVYLLCTCTSRSIFPTCSRYLCGRDIIICALILHCTCEIRYRHQSYMTCSVRLIRRYNRLRHKMIISKKNRAVMSTCKMCVAYRPTVVCNLNIVYLLHVSTSGPQSTELGLIKNSQHVVGKLSATTIMPIPEAKTEIIR
jgi:hypothetical protein